ncbi:MAG: PAS domain S-box protein [bacterium]|nr:PAS domain S-box protein [bacterium]
MNNSVDKKLQNELNIYTELEQIFQASPDGMFVVDNNNTIIRINNSLLKLMGKTRDEVRDRPCLDVFGGQLCVEECYCNGNAEICYFENRLREQNNMEIDRPIELQPGIILHCIVTATLLKVEEKHAGIIFNIKDITERKIAENLLKTSLAEKEILLKEIHHRVKNNLQLISSLLTLQESYSDNKTVNKSLEDTRNRIRSMGIIHEQLYASNDFSRIAFAEYAVNFVDHLAGSYKIDRDKILIEVDIEGVYLNLTTAIPCGLLLNELVSNSFQFAFPGDREGVVCIEMRLDDTGCYSIIVSDNGIGLPEHINLNNNHKLGLELVSALTLQLDGTIILERDMGTKYIIQFNKTIQK